MNWTGQDRTGLDSAKQDMTAKEWNRQVQTGPDRTRQYKFDQT